MCWLYFVPNLLVFQQLDILYLGGDHVRVVCEKVWRIQVCMHSERFSWLDLASDPRLATRQHATRVKHAGNWRVMTAGALQNKKDSLACSYLATHPSSEWVARTPCFAEKCLFTFFTYPTINILIPMKCRELLERIWRETLEKNKIDSFTILDIWFSKFLYTHPFHWHTLERFISQILISPYPYQWRVNLVLGKQFRDE